MLKGIKESIQSIPLRNTLTQVIALGLILSTILMILNSLILIMGCTPVVLVRTRSMEPIFKRGDILFFNLKKTPDYVGEIVDFKIKDREIPIIYRVIETTQLVIITDQVKLLTKGDNSPMDDSYGIYAKGQMYLENKDVAGRVIGYLPYVGYPSVIIAEFLIKYFGMTPFFLTITIS